MVQVEPGAIVPLFSVTDVPPLTAVNEAGPPHPVNVGETRLARKTLAGRLSTREAWVKVALGWLFAMKMESWPISPAHIVAGLKLLLTDGSEMPATFKVALAGLVLVMIVPSPVEVNAPAGMVLIRFPAVVEVTLIETVHDPGVIPSWAGTVALFTDKVVEPAAAVAEPPQELVNPTGLAMLRPG